MKLFDRIFFSGGTKLAALGDALVMSPVVHKFAEESKHVLFPARRSNIDTIKCLFQDYPNIEIVPYSTEIEIEQYLRDNKPHTIAAPDITLTDIYIPNFSQYVRIPINWDRQFYEFYDIPFSQRYSGFRFPNHIEGSDELYYRLTNGDNNYVIFHQMTGHHPNGMNINLAAWRQSCNLPPYKIIEVTSDITSNMFQYKKLIENAREIHCVPSSFFCLVDSMVDQTYAGLFYHNIRAITMMHVNSKWNNNRWQIVNYKEKL